MARSENQKLKMLYLVKILSEETDAEHPMPMPELLKKLEAYGVKAERKSIYSDISYLNESELYEIEYVRENNKKGYYMASHIFELPECKLLVDAVAASKFITASRSRELIEDIKKLVSKHEAVQLQRQVYNMGSIKSENAGGYFRVDEIFAAIRQNKQIAFQYQEWNLKKELVPRKNGKVYQISPWSLMWNDENYYLIGYDKEADSIKHYRVDKMGKVTMLEELREGEEAFKKCDMSVYSAKTFGMYGGKEERVTIQFPNHLIGVVIDRFGKETSLQKVTSDSFAIHVNVAVSGQFFGWLAGVGKQAKLVAPDYVKDAYKAYLKEIIED